MPRTEDQFKKIRADKQKLIKDTALKLFAEQGYQTVSIQQITKTAGISKGLIYNYFESKEELLKSIMFEAIDNMLDNFDPNHDGVLEQHELIGYIDKSFNKIRDNFDFWKLFYSLVVQPSVFELLMLKYAELFEPYFKMLTAYFTIKGCENPQTESVFFTALLDGLAMNYLLDPEHFPFDDIKEKVKKLYM